MALDGSQQLRVAIDGVGRKSLADFPLLMRGPQKVGFNTDDLGRMVADLHSSGVRRIDGSFYVQNRALPTIPFIDGDQPDYLGYNPTISGMNLNFNRVHFKWRRGADGYRTTMDARAKRHAPAVEMATMRIVSRDFPVYGYALEKGRDAWTVSRSALGGGGARVPFDLLPYWQPRQVAVLGQPHEPMPLVPVLLQGGLAAKLADHYAVKSDAPPGLVVYGAANLLPARAPCKDNSYLQQAAALNQNSRDLPIIRSQIIKFAVGM